MKKKKRFRLHNVKVYLLSWSKYYFKIKCLVGFILTKGWRYKSDRYNVIVEWDK